MLRDSSTPFRDSSTPFRDSSTPFRDSSTPFRDSSTPFRDSSTGFRDSSAALLDFSGIPPYFQMPCYPYPRPPRRWGTAIGAWGDCLIAAGTMQSRLGRGGIIVYSQDSRIADFLEAQPFVDGVWYIRPESRTHYKGFIRWSSQLDAEGEAGQEGAMRWLAEAAGMDPAAVVPTHIDLDLWKQGRVHHWDQAASVPAYALQWADRKCEGLPEKFYLLQPYSFQSCEIADCWTGWQDAAEWLLTQTPHTFALTGQGYDVGGSHPRLVNLLNTAPDMACVFALAMRSAGVITCCNSLSHFAVIQKFPALVVGNRMVSREPSNYFRRWLNAPNIRFIGVDHTLRDFAAEASALFGL